MKLRFNKDKLIPDLRQCIKVVLVAFVIVYILKEAILKLFPFLTTLSDFWLFVFWVLTITYLKNLFDIRIGGEDYF